MKFSRISLTTKGVELDYVETDGDAKNETTHSCQMPPLGSFTDALQGFTSYVVDLIPFLEPARETLTVTTLNLSEDKNGLRDVPIEAIMGFSLEDRVSAIRWAELRQKELTGQMESVFMPVEPDCVARSATLPLKADEWTADAPVRVTDSEAKEIVAAARAD